MQQQGGLRYTHRMAQSNHTGVAGVIMIEYLFRVRVKVGPVRVRVRGH